MLSKLKREFGLEGRGGWGEDRSIREMWNDKMGEVFEGVIRRFSWSIVLIWKGLNNILARIRFF